MQKISHYSGRPCCCLVAESCLTLTAGQTSLPRGFSRQGHWSGLLFPSPGNLPDRGTEDVPSPLQADSLPLRQLGSPLEYQTLSSKSKIVEENRMNKNKQKELHKLSLMNHGLGRVNMQIDCRRTERGGMEGKGVKKTVGGGRGEKKREGRGEREREIGRE